MNRAFKVLTIVALALMIALPATAQEKKKKKKGAGQNQQVAALMKKLESANLEDGQLDKIKGIVKEYAPQLQEIAAKRRDKIGRDAMQAMAAARKEATDAGKKGKEAQDAALAALSDEQRAVYNETQAAQSKVMGEMQGKIIEVIGADKARELKLGGGGKKGGNKKKKNAA
ncbi:MAG: hypothetical protein KDB14_08825 [Planctomycetales bacterium]|nr:hypothetical protein [Planctomycetales bacterium]